MSEPVFKFELRRLADRSDKALIAELQRVATLVTGPITRDAYSEIGKVGRTTLERRFGSWEAALTAAGLIERAHPSAMKLSDGQVIEELRRIAGKLGKNILTIAEVERHSKVNGDRLRRTWGTAKKAFEAAGLNSTPLGKRYDDEERFENLLQVWTHYGRPPKYLEMSVQPSTVGGKAYKGRYGSWIGALEAFVERVNGPDVLVPAQTTEILAVATLAPDRGPRDVPLGLRFKILQRDRFRCALCGNNPPVDSNCVLHVDHIQPWSLGGNTAIENLRTLCATCNLGRSNRYTINDEAV